jgi:hypothetical protein
VTELLVARCSPAAARYAVEHWHYSRIVAAGKNFYRGVWEDGRFVGALVIGPGASPFMAPSWGLKQTEACELMRVALDRHVSPVTQIVAEAIRQLRASSPGLRLIVSFADPGHGHHGGIYQAGGWTYCGTSAATTDLVIRGRQTHIRGVGSTYGTTSLEWIRANVDPNAYAVQAAPKYRYAIGFDRGAKRLVAARAQTPPARLDHAVKPTRVPDRRVAAENVSP